MKKIKTIQKKEDIPEEFWDTPVGDLLLYHNCQIPQKNYEKAELLIGMCIDNRVKLNIPNNFAYICRVGGANLRNIEFVVSYAIAVGGLEYIALIGHTQCAMVNLVERKEQFIKGLCDAGWDTQMAEDHFREYSPMFEIGDEIDFVLNETKRFSLKYPKVQVVPLLYKVKNNLLYWIDRTA